MCIVLQQIESYQGFMAAERCHYGQCKWCCCVRNTCYDERDAFLIRYLHQQGKSDAYIARRMHRGQYAIELITTEIVRPKIFEELNITINTPVTGFDIWWYRIHGYLNADEYGDNAAGNRPNADSAIKRETIDVDDESDIEILDDSDIEILD